MHVQLIEYLASVAGLGVLTWGGTQGLHLMTREVFDLKKIWFALPLGPALGVVGHGAGFLPVPSAGPWGWAMAALTGLLGAAAASLGHDAGKYVIAAVTKPKDTP